MSEICLGLIGKKLSHSFSPAYFSGKFRDNRLEDISYCNYEINHIDELIDVINRFDLNGFNVTIPFKEDVFSLCDWLSPEAREIGAVNCVVVEKSESTIKLKGYNTDCPAFLDTLKKYDLSQGQKALILGTGGSAKAVSHALKTSGIIPVHVSRRKTKNTFQYRDDLPIEECKIIVNCTPLGMYPNVNDSPNIPFHKLTSDHIVYDLIYNPEKTSFLQKAEEKGCILQNGMEMLITQAELSWSIWKEHFLLKETPDDSYPKTKIS